MTGPWIAFVESNTTGTGREFCSAAITLGLRPVVLARDGGRYPWVADDQVALRVTDTGDLAAVLDACARLADDGGLAGVASSSDHFVATAARAAARLGLPAPDADAVTRCRAKDLQRAALRAAGVLVPAFAVAEDGPGAERAAASIGYPVVVKPVTGSGSVGVRLCRDAGETRRHAAGLLARASDERGTPVPQRVLVEAAVSGPEFSVETFDGAVVAVVAKHLGPEPHFVETGHDLPAVLAADAEGRLGDTARQALTALGLGWGAAHTELRLSPAGPVVIEVNPRLAGGMIPVALRAATGVDLVAATVARAAGVQPAPGTPGAGHAAIRFVLAGRDGRVTAVRGLAGAAAAPGVVTATATTAVGREIRRTGSFLDRVACVVATGSDAPRAALRAEEAARLVRVEIVDANPDPDPVTSLAAGPTAGAAAHPIERGASGR
jgi:biotin carboxylase